MTATDDIGGESGENDIDAQADSWQASMDRLEAIRRQNRANHREIRAILLAIANHLDLTCEKPDTGSQSD